MEELFKTRKMAAGVTLIEGLGHEYCYLVQGNEKALLIDTLSGIGDLKAFCKTITKLPITVVNTHGHFDHAGGNFVFEEIYIHPVDIPLMYDCCTAVSRENFVNLIRKERNEPQIWHPEDIVPSREIHCNLLSEGDVFDLGGRLLEVVETPGHTRGSVCFLDRENRLLFAGDCCNTNTFLFMPGAVTVEEYSCTLKKLQLLEKEFDTYYICHETTPLDKRCIDEAILCCEEIMVGKDDAEPGENLGMSCFYAKKRNGSGMRTDGKLANIAYRKDRIFREM